MERSVAAGRRPIQRLDPTTIERIAAGEVVERPASVVKELLENALDAGASAITVRLANGGLDRIEVADNGGGIPPDELELAVERHATSKIAPEGPIELGTTLGFRGEALAAIATVARFTLTSRAAERDAAESIRVDGGTRGARSLAGRAPGTTVEVRDLFYNTPARRKFLRSPAAEQVEIARTVERVYLAHPSVAVELIADGQRLGTYPAAPELADAASRVLGPEFRRGSFRVEGPVPGGRVEGYLGRPALAASSSRSLYLSVNGRAIEARAIQQSVRAAFGDYLPRARFPIGVLHLELGSADVDANVHPTKREVRFARPSEIAEAVRLRVRAGLVAGPQVAELSDAVLAPRSATLPASRSLPPSGDSEAGAVAGSASGRARFQQQTLAGRLPESASASVAGVRGHPRLVLYGCLQSLYWIAEGDEGLVLVDQHAASERVLFEGLRKDRPVTRQSLVAPVPLRLTGAQEATLAAHGADLHRAGFEVAPFGPGVQAVRTVPSFGGRRAQPGAVVELLDELAAGGRPTQPDGLVERTAASLACHAAIRAGDSVPPAEFARVLDALYALAEPAYSCPHGRPILLQIPRSRLDRWFLRSGP